VDGDAAFANTVKVVMNSFVTLEDDQDFLLTMEATQNI
jgi:hypothetical protein